MRRTLEESQKKFQFTKENLKKIKELISHYPKGKQSSAVIAVLYLAQDQNEGWVSKEAIEAVGAVLEMPSIRVYEVASFYTMFNLHPVGNYFLQVCTTTPCLLRGADGILSVCQKKAQEYGEKVFSVTEVECLGGCVNAPIVQINNDFYEDLTSDSTKVLLDNLAKGKTVEPGSQIGRQCSRPLKEGERNA